MGSPRTWAFTGRPRRLRVLIVGAVVAALVLPAMLSLWPLGLPALGALTDPVALPYAGLLTAAALLAVSVVNVELGRVLDGGVKHTQRPHKALSAWALGAALLLPAWWLVPVVTTIYAHARWRGMRVQLWKWVGSGAYVVLAALVAGAVAGALRGPGAHALAQGPRGLLAVVAASAVFLAVETLLFLGSAYLNDADDEVWLRRTLAGPRFYVTEAGMLVIGGLSAAVWVGTPWLLPLLLPVYGLAQQAALHEPLQHQATTDTKTGVYRYESWHQLARAELDRCTAKGRPWSVVFTDLDRFKPYNDTWGHLAGDSALAAVADLLRAHLRGRDLLGRFGGEEFCIFLPDTGPDEAGEVAERLRVAVEGLRLPDTDAQVTVSVGVAGMTGGGRAQAGVDLADTIGGADKALYLAKDRGRNTVCVLDVVPAVRPARGAVA